MSSPHAEHCCEKDNLGPIWNLTGVEELLQALAYFATAGKDKKVCRLKFLGEPTMYFVSTKK